VWTEDDTALLRDLYLSGVPTPEIGLQLGLSDSQLFKKLQQFGLSGQRADERVAQGTKLREEVRRLHKQGLTQAEIGQIIGRHQVTVGRLLRSANPE
jgi:hypothetical protein